MQKPDLSGVKTPILKYIEFLESKVETFEQSPLVDSYLALYNQLQKWNKQLSGKEINLFDTSSKDIFAMAHKYLTEQKPYIDQLEYLRKLMSPEQEKQMRERVKVENLGIAEKLALKDNGR